MLEHRDLPGWEGSTEDERKAIAIQIDEGYRQALDGHLIDGEQAKRDIESMKIRWRAARG